MGLVQRQVEAAGISTVALSMIPELTVAAGVPRVAAIGYPMGRPMGLPGDADGQRAVLRAMLQLAVDARPPETLACLPFEWPESPAKARATCAEPPPISRLIMKKPWLLRNLLTGDIPADSELTGHASASGRTTG